MKTLAVVQARMASNRLPGKVMKDLGGRPALEWAVRAAQRAPGVDDVVVATSINPENLEIYHWCVDNGIECLRGSEDDVLDRYCAIIRAYDPEEIVRLTADCPLLDSQVIGSVVALKLAAKVPYASCVWPPTWPDGLDTEVVDAEALLVAGEEATDQIDRDTVTQYIVRNQSRWPAINLTCPLPGMEAERWVLDSPEDYELLKLIVDYFPPTWQPNYLDIWNFLNAHPEYREINRQWYRNQRFYEALGTQTLATKSFDRTQNQLQRAVKVIPCGSQTFSKSCHQYPSTEAPLFASHGDGAYIFDIDGNRYVDLVGSLLPNVLGYNDPSVNFAIRHQLDRGISLSLATELEEELAEIFCDLILCAESVRFGKNGSDATSGAIRLARAYTGRDRVGIIAGEGYHGWHDWAIANTPRDKGVPGLVKSLTRRMRPQIEEIKEDLCRHRYAAIIIDPENHDLVFLSALKEECERTGAVFIFDEIRTGFRYALGGYQELTGVIPDLACFGKSMANGMPISAICGRKDIMAGLSEIDGPFWSGTFFGETLSLAAAIATISKIKECGVIDELWDIGNSIIHTVGDMLIDADIESISLSGMAPRVIVECEDMDKFRRCMIAQGVLIINSNNVCYAMGTNEIGRIQSAYEWTIRKFVECGIS